MEQRLSNICGSKTFSLGRRNLNFPLDEPDSSQIREGDSITESKSYNNFSIPVASNVNRPTSLKCTSVTVNDNFANFLEKDEGIYLQRQIIMQQEQFQKHAILTNGRKMKRIDSEFCPVKEELHFDVVSWPQYEDGMISKTDRYRRNQELLSRNRRLPNRFWSALFPDSQANTSAVISSSSAKKRRIFPDPAYILHLSILMVRDGREAQAIEILKRRLASLSLIKKSDLRCLVNELFLRSLDKGFDDLVLLLIDCGFPENFNSAIYGHTKTRRFPSYLLLSVCLGRLRIVEKICEIQPRVHLNKGWFNGIRPLMLAQMTPKLTWKSFQMTELLLKTGAEPNRSITYNTFLEGLRFRRCRLSKTDEGEGSRGLREIYKKTRLYAIDFACVRGKFESVQLLLRFEKRPWRDWLGRSEFCLLRLLNFEVAAEILRRIPELIKQRDPRGNTPLHWAAKMGRTDLIALYLKYSETVDVLNRMHWTPLHEAAASAHRSTVQYLISRGADCSIRNLEGQTALQVARENGISSEELFDFFHSADTMQKTLKLLGQLVIPGALEGQQVAPLKGTSRLLIQKLMKYPKKFFKKSFKTV